MKVHELRLYTAKFSCSDFQFSREMREMGMSENDV
jgi:hypothetical protein